VSAGDPAQAQPACEELSDAQRERTAALFESSYIHDCCDQTLDRCLEQQPRCLLAVRLAGNICRRVAAGQEDEQIRLALTTRARIALPAAGEAAFDLASAPRVGEPDAPVAVVLFADARGHNCARLTPQLHQAVVRGPLTGKVQLHVRMFPLRSNPHAKEAGVAFLAAHDLGAFWEFALHAYARDEVFELAALPVWAEAVGLDAAVFEERIADPALVERLVASKREGLEHGVESTPTLFIDGQRYQGELEIREIVDVLEELHDRATGRVYEP